MIFDTTLISKLYAAEAEKSAQLLKVFHRTTPQVARTALKTTTGLTKQLLFVSGGRIGILSYPTVTTDEANRLRLLGCFGGDADTLAPAALSGELLHQSFSTLVPKAMASKYSLPTLAADPSGRPSRARCPASVRG